MFTVQNRMETAQIVEKPTESSYFASIRIGQAWKDILLWEIFLNSHESKSILELGTWRGAMGIFIAVQCHARGMKFATIDVHPCEPNAAHTIQTLGGALHNFDLFVEVERTKQIIAELPHPTILFCDNGNKPEEFKRYVPCLQTGDYVVVHDWGTEFFESNIVHPVEQVMIEESEELESITRFFRV